MHSLSRRHTCRITGGISSLRLFVQTSSKINKGHSEALNTRSAYQYEAYACALIFSLFIEYTSPCFTFRVFTISSTSFNFCEQVFHLLSRLTSLRFLNFLFVGDVPSPLFWAWHQRVISCGLLVLKQEYISAKSSSSTSHTCFPCPGSKYPISWISSPNSAVNCSLSVTTYVNFSVSLSFRTIYWLSRLAFMIFTE